MIIFNQFKSARFFPLSPATPIELFTSNLINTITSYQVVKHHYFLPIKPKLLEYELKASHITKKEIK